MKVTNYILAASLLCLFLFSCKTSSTSRGSSSKADIYSEDYYLSLGSNLERLQTLKTGAFVQYREYWAHDTIVPWKVNEGKDSMILFISKVGNPNKDGYWIYYHQFLSNLPNDPVYTAYEKLEMLSRDTFKGTYYSSPTTFEWEQVIKKDKTVNQLDFNSLEATGEEVFYVRKNATSFEGFSVIYKNITKSESHRKFRQDKYFYSPEEFIIDIYFYKDVDGSDENRSAIVEHLRKRRIEEMPLKLIKP